MLLINFRQIFDDPDEGLDIIMELVILGMLLYIWYIKLFPLDEPFITQTPRWKRATSSTTRGRLQEWEAGEEPILDNLASFVLRCERKLCIVFVLNMCSN